MAKRAKHRQSTTKRTPRQPTIRACVYQRDKYDLAWLRGRFSMYLRITNIPGFTSRLFETDPYDRRCSYASREAAEEAAKKAAEAFGIAKIVLIYKP